MKLSVLKNKISKFPQSPGVYIFYGKGGSSAPGGFRRAQILYIGKATNLRSRVGSYFSLVPTSPSSALRAPSPERRRGYGRPIETMIYEVSDIKTIQTDSVLEALILEANLIKKHQPRYNAMGKDDKSFSYFVITKDQFPRVMILRETELSEKNVIASKAKQSRPENYKIRLPRRYAPRNDSSSAGRTFGPYTSKKQMEIALKIIRKIFPFHSIKQQTEKGCLDFQIGRCPGPYAGAITPEDYKKNIQGIKMILEGKKKNLVKKMEKEMKELSKKHEYEKAAEIRNKVFALKHIQDVALISVDTHNVERGAWNGNDMRYELRDMRIEAYDISNISGQYATGSMIVFKNGEPDRAQYRKFKIKTIQGANDVGMMREVLLRRFKNDWPQPDLIFLDGGKGHLNMAEKLTTELGMKILIVAVAKGAKRKNVKIQMSNFSPYGGSPEGRKFLISKQIPRLPKPGTGGQAMFKNPKEISNLLNNKVLIKGIMNEAHRFAVRYHKKLRKNGLLA